MRIAIPVFIACWVAACLTGCRAAPEQVAAAPEAPPNADLERFGLVDDRGIVIVRLGATLEELHTALPKPADTRFLPEAELPAGFEMVAWVQEEDRKGKPAGTLMAYFYEGRLVELSYSVAPLTNAEATAWAKRYEAAFGKPHVQKEAGRTLRSFGREQDACRLRLDTTQVGGEYRCTATLIDTERVKKLQDGLRAMRTKKR